MAKKSPAPADEIKDPFKDTVDYDQEWAEWGDMSHHAPTPIHTRRLILREAAMLPFKSVLDIGCGIGTLISEVRDRFPGRSYTGSDVSKNAVARARRYHPEPEIDFQVLDIQSGALDRTFDLILLSEVIEHLEHPLTAMKNIRRMCSGYLILTTPTGKRLPTDLAFYHLKHFTPKELGTLAQEAGFEVVRLYRWGWPFQMLFRWLINLHPSWAHDTFVRGGNYGWLKKAVSVVWTTLFYLNVTGRGTQQVLVAKAK